MAEGVSQPADGAEGAAVGELGVEVGAACPASVQSPSQLALIGLAVPKNPTLTASHT